MEIICSSNSSLFADKHLYLYYYNQAATSFIKYVLFDKVERFIALFVLRSSDTI